jgi:spore maturation protein CgeB
VTESDGHGPLPETRSFLVVGEGIWPWYMTAAAEALRSLGFTVHEFHWADTFKEMKQGEVEPQHRSTRHRIEERVAAGPIVRALNKRLLTEAAELRPDYVWFYNVRLIYPRTVNRLRQLLPNAVFGQYANDNPFSEHASFGFWRHFLNSSRLFDLHFAYRTDNLADFERMGSKHTYMLRSYFLPDLDRPIPEEELVESDRSDILFAGHFEDDGRLEMLRNLASRGFRLRLHGGGWTPVLAGLPPLDPLKKLWPAKPIVGDEYRRAISGTKVALCFLSTVNKDTYTRRNFEIPAIGSVMLSQFSEDLGDLFRDGEEVEFFRNGEELASKVVLLLSDEERRTRLSELGNRRVHQDGHDVVSRMQIVAQAFGEHSR